MKKWCKSIDECVKLSIILLLFFVLIIGYNFYYIDNYYTKIQSRLDKYDETINDIEGKLKNENYDLMIEFYKLRLDWTNEKIKLEAEQGYVEGEIHRIYIYGGAFILIITLLGGLIYKNAETYIENKVFKGIKEKLEVKKDLIEDVIEDKVKELQVISEKKILMLAENPDKNKEVKSFLNKMEFKHLDTKKLDDKHNKKNYDLIFINNKDGNIVEKNDDKNLKDYVKEVVSIYGEDKVYFYYNNTEVRFPNNGIKCNHANSKFTLYRQLVDTLIVSDKI